MSFELTAMLSLSDAANAMVEEIRKNEPTFALKFLKDETLIEEHLQCLPPEFLSDGQIFQAAIISATVQAEQTRRKSGDYTFREHVLEVAKGAFEKALLLQQKGEIINPKRCAIIGLLHDTLEDCEKEVDGLKRSIVEHLILQTFGEEIYHEVTLLTMDVGMEIKDKTERDEVQTKEWEQRILRMKRETQIVKLSDIENNNADGETTRKSKVRQRKELVKHLDLYIFSM